MIKVVVNIEYVQFVVKQVQYYIQVRYGGQCCVNEGGFIFNFMIKY